VINDAANTMRADGVEPADYFARVTRAVIAIWLKDFSRRTVRLGWLPHTGSQFSRFMFTSQTHLPLPESRIYLCLLCGQASDLKATTELAL
jgi:hypothetical protein